MKGSGKMYGKKTKPSKKTKKRKTMKKGKKKGY
jgi:hypothetical protein